MNIDKEMKQIKMKQKVRKIKTVVLLLVVITICIGSFIPFNFNDHSYTITVTDKERVVTGNKNNARSKYIVFGDTDDGESLVFENTDSLLRLKFNSSNIQGQLKEGCKYHITVVGIRIPFFSEYENIISVEEK